jgi:ferredoxin
LTIIYYFSGTGNTLWSARRIKALLEAPSSGGELVEAVELRRIAPPFDRPEPIRLGAEDKLVFLFPAYALQMPVGVSRFMRNVSIEQTQDSVSNETGGRQPYICCCVTCGSHQGGALAEAERIFRKKGLPLSYVGVIPAVENYIPLFGYPRKAIRDRKLPRQVAATETCAQAIKEGRTNKVRTFHPFFALVSALFHLGVKFMWMWYKVDTNPASPRSCTGCGTCAKVCPAHAITMKDGRPVFGGACEQCMGCFSWCPRHALSTYGRFHPGTPAWTHPEVAVKDMI